MALALIVAACSAVVDDAPSADDTTSVPSDPSTGSGDSSDPEAGNDSAADSDSDADGGDDGAGDTESEATEGDGTEGTDDALADDDVRALLDDLEGQLAIGNGPVVAVARPDGQRYVELDGGQTNLASQPTWSADGGQLIWSSVSPLTQEARVQRFNEEGVAEGDPLVTDVPGQPIFYFQWSDSGRDILYLRNSSRRQTVEAGVLTAGGPARWLADGDPFFVAWAPNEPVIAAHVADERVALFDPADAAELGAPIEGGEDDQGAGPLPLPRDPAAGDDVVDGGGFSAPAWLDDTTLVTVVDGVLSAVDVDEGVIESLAAVEGPIRFVLSPDRTKVAFQLATDLVGDDDTLEVALSTPTQEQASDRSLVVVDVTDGSVDVVTDRPAVAWDWSPDSAKLAWLELDGPLDRRRARWRFWSDQGPVIGDIRSPTVRLSIKEVVNYLPFFAQYSFSLQRWSPDSSAFALVGSINGRGGVWIQLVDVPAAPVLVAPGDIVSWGFGPTPLPDAGRSPI